MNDIKIVMLFKLYSSYLNMTEDVGSVVDSENGSSQNQITCRLPRKASQAAASIAESATKEFQSLAKFMPNLADTDARTLALQLYYIELTDGVSPIRARNKVSHMFLAIRHPSILYVVQPQGKCSCIRISKIRHKFG